MGLHPSVQQHEHRHSVAGQEETRKAGRASRGMEEWWVGGLDPRAKHCRPAKPTWPSQAAHRASGPSKQETRVCHEGGWDCRVTRFSGLNTNNPMQRGVGIVGLHGFQGSTPTTPCRGAPREACHMLQPASGGQAGAHAHGSWAVRLAMRDSTLTASRQLPTASAPDTMASLQAGRQAGACGQGL